jgi:hypothetical protein
MIERYTIKFGAAVCQKELEKALHEDRPAELVARFSKMKARIELIGDFEDLKKVNDILKEMTKQCGGDARVHDIIWL